MYTHKAKMQSNLLNFDLPQEKQLKIQNKIQLYKCKCKYIYKCKLLPMHLGTKNNHIN